MRILWIKVGGLWPATSGGRLRSFHIVDELSQNHEVTVITTHHPEEDGDELARHLPRCKQIISLPYAAPKAGSYRFVLSLVQSWFSVLPVDLYKNRAPGLRCRVEELMNSGQFDLCIADFLFAVPNTPMDGRVPVVFFAHNVESMIWKRLCRNDRNPLRRCLLELEWRKMHRYERNVSRRADLTLAVSAEDRDHFINGSGQHNVFDVPTGVNIEYFRSDEDVAENARELVFTGSMDWYPNEDAMLYFIESILPAVRREVPDVTISIVGRNPGQRLRRTAEMAGVTVTGTVEDVRPYIERAAVYVVPLRIGGGTRLKIFEALSMGKAVVSTTVGAEGLPLEEGRHILRADEPEDFAAKVVALLNNPSRRTELGGHGRTLMEQRFAWSRVANEFERHCQEVLTT